MKNIFRRSASTLSALIVCFLLSFVGSSSVLAVPNLSGCLDNLASTGICSVSNMNFYVTSVTVPDGNTDPVPLIGTLMGSLDVTITDKAHVANTLGNNFKFEYVISSILAGFRISEFSLPHFVGIFGGSVTDFGPTPPADPNDPNDPNAAGLVMVTNIDGILNAEFNPFLLSDGAPYPSFFIETLDAPISGDLSNFVGDTSLVIGVNGAGNSIGPGVQIIGAAFSPTPTPQPEPATVLLLGSGLLGLVVLRRRKFASNKQS